MSVSIEAILRKTPLFASLSEPEMQALVTRTTRRRFGRDEQLFAEGDPCTGLYLVVAGKVRIFKLSPTGREQVLAVEGPGSSFAELPVFDGGDYPAAASAVEDTEALFISRTDFQNFCREHPDVALKVIAVVGSRLRRHHRRTFFHDGASAFDRIADTPRAGERYAVRSGHPYRANQKPSGPGRRTGYGSRVGFPEPQPPPG